MVLFLGLFVFSLYGTIYGSILDDTTYHINTASEHSNYAPHSSRSGSSSHYSGNGGYSSGK